MIVCCFKYFTVTSLLLHQGRLVPLSEIELDLILTQTPKNSPVKLGLSTELQKEGLSPLSRQ